MTDEKMVSSNNITPPPEEYFDVLDENGEKTGRTKLRREVHRNGDWHRAVDVFVVKGDEVLLQKRCATKDSYPDTWDLSCGGHITAGEDSLETAVRELEEELGLKARPEELEFVGSFKASARPAPDFVNNSFNDMYILRTEAEISELRFQEEEISALKYVPIREFREMVRRGVVYSSDRSPDGLGGLEEGLGEGLVPHPQMYEKFFEVMGLVEHKNSLLMSFIFLLYHRL